MKACRWRFVVLAAHFLVLAMAAWPAIADDSSPVDPGMVGTWCLAVQARGEPTILVWTIGADGHDQITSKGPAKQTDNTGQAQFSNGLWKRRGEAGGGNGGSYELRDLNTAAITGKDGKTLLWLRIADASAAGAPPAEAPPADAGQQSVDPSMVGTWRSVMPPQNELIAWTINPDGHYTRTFQGPIDIPDESGQTHFADGKWDIKSEAGHGNHGIYTLRDPQTAAITGAAGKTSIWLRLADVGSGNPAMQAAAPIQVLSPPDSNSPAAAPAESTPASAAPTGPVVDFPVPTAGPFVQSPPLMVDLSHQDLPGPDPRYTSWQGSKVGDYVLSSLKFHTAEGDGTGQEMDYLYGVDPDGVMVLTLTKTTLDAKPTETYWKGYFTYYSANAINPADAGLIAGLQSGQDVPSPVPSAKVGTDKSYTVNHWKQWDTALSVWANPKIPNLMTMSVRSNKTEIWVKTLIACHRADGESWPDTNVSPDTALMLELADPVKGPKPMSFTRMGDSWVGKYDTGMRSENPIMQAKNVSFTVEEFVLEEKDDAGKTTQTDVDYVLGYGAGAIRNVKHGHWTPWHEVHPDIDPGIIESIDYSVADHVWKWADSGGRAAQAFQSAPVYRPPFQDFAKPEQVKAALVLPDAPLPPEDKRDGSETDHWGNLVLGTGQDGYLAVHLAEPAPQPKQPLVYFRSPDFGCTFLYDSQGTQLQFLEDHYARLIGPSYNDGDENFDVLARPIDPDDAAPSLDAEYHKVLDQHKDDANMAASRPVKVRFAGLDGYAFTIDARDKDDNDIRTVELFAISPHRTLKLDFTVLRAHSEQSWAQLRQIAGSVHLQD